MLSATLQAGRIELRGQLPERAFKDTVLEGAGENGKTTVINLRFPGQYYDQESGLHYNWNRYYSNFAHSNNN